MSQVSEAELVAYYNRAMVVAFVPYLEPFGLVPLEAMACGTPVIGVREGGVRETVSDGQSGLLIDRDPRAFAAALGRILDDQAFAGRLGIQARAYVEQQWTWERSVDQLEHCFEHFIKDTTNHGITDVRDD